MAKVSTSGILVKFMMVNGKTVLRMAMEYGKVKTVTPTLVNGSTAKLTATVSIHGHPVISMRVSGKNVSSMAKALTSSQTMMYSQALTLMVNHLVKASTSGVMVVYILEISRMV